ncbi:hypothetical protein I5535_00160 [Rhodobacteraceae bacterium F11138]|nr:hypothetical protein [Rhodobacteraceae bacterium F11138]
MDPLSPLISALHGEGRLRVWSLVITIFGDLVQHRGGQVSTTRLRAVLGRVGVEQGALRTALSRLGSDGWVTRERMGRTSQYRLSAQGIARFAPATTRIYAPPRAADVKTWAAIVSLDASGTQTIRICPADEAVGPADCRIEGDLQSVSGRFRQAMLDPGHRSALMALASDLRALETPITRPLDAAAARMLLIHRWRRIVLRYPDLAPELMPDDAPLRDPRASVARCHAGLTPLAEAWLDSEIEGQKPMPNATDAAENRFRLAGKT